MCKQIRWISLMMVLMTMMLIIPLSVAAESKETTTDKVSVDEAIAVSIGHIVSTVNPESEIRKSKNEEILQATDQKIVELTMEGQPEEASDWEKGVDLKCVTPLFDMDDEINAYLIELYDLNKNPAGYIIINANKYGYPILEFSDSGQHYYYNAMEALKEADASVAQTPRLYYLGSGIMFAGSSETAGNQKLYSINTPELNAYDKTKLKESAKQITTNLNDVGDQNIVRWNELTNCARKSTEFMSKGHSTPTYPLSDPGRNQPHLNNDRHLRVRGQRIL